MDNHLRVAWTHRALSLVYLFIAVVLLAIVAFIARGDRGVGFLFLAPALPAALFGLHHCIARGAERRAPWARIASIVVACLLLPGFPIGTAIGVYLLVNNWREPAAPAHGTPA